MRSRAAQNPMRACAALKTVWLKVAVRAQPELACHVSKRCNCSQCFLSLPCGRAMHCLQFCFSLPWGKGCTHATVRSYSVWTCFALFAKMFNKFKLLVWACTALSAGLLQPTMHSSTFPWQGLHCKHLCDRLPCGHGAVGRWPCRPALHSLQRSFGFPCSKCIERSVILPCHGDMILKTYV